VARESAALAFRRKKRGMLAGDVLKQVSAAFQASFPIDDDEGDEGEDQQGMKWESVYWNSYAVTKDYGA
jgi:hypothetical protein